MQVSNFIGHAFNIHQNIYRPRPTTLDIVEMSNLLNFARVFEKLDATHRSLKIFSNIFLQSGHEGIAGTFSEGVTGISTERISEASRVRTYLGWVLRLAVMKMSAHH
ncbi:hypothetical protein WA026_022707 [Henosepilachna vigintioctopunctata]|uniref:Uncharacterized protein n=1 Tax=Henosepilachna vigintioctopunctata TaxID=420089 RepID=A0AAW1TYN3_9CUCU